VNVDRHRDPAAVDLTPLDPTADSAAFDARAAMIVRDATAARAGNATRFAGAALMAMTRWTRPILAAAAVIAVVAISVLQRATPRASASRGGALAAAPGPAERLGLPAPIVALAQSPRAPTPAEVVAAFDQTWIRGQ
jgi:hypothetical protein